MGVPAGDVGEDLRLVKSLEDGNVGLGGGVAEWEGTGVVS